VDILSQCREVFNGKIVIAYDLMSIRI
jgi:hypothetical protein